MKIETFENNALQQSWRPKAVFHYIQDYFIKPDFVIDITPFMEKKMEAVKAFASQFHDPASKEPETAISTPEFFDFIMSRALNFGRAGGFKYAEGFTAEKTIGVKDFYS